MGRELGWEEREEYITHPDEAILGQETGIEPEEDDGGEGTDGTDDDEVIQIGRRHLDETVIPGKFFILYYQQFSRERFISRIGKTIKAPNIGKDFKEAIKRHF